MHNAKCHNMNYFCANTSLLCWSYVLPSGFLSSASDSVVPLRLILRPDIICYTNYLHDVLLSAALCRN